MTIFQMLPLLIAGHFIADYPLQGDFLARAKNRFNPVPGIPWYQALLAHGVIHGAFVGVITGSVLMGIFETIVHMILDDAKCAGKISFDQDQALHILYKISYCAALSFTVPW